MKILKSLFYIGVIGITFYSLAIWLFEPIEMKGASMEPAVVNGDRYLSQKVTLFFNKPKVGDIVIYNYRKDGKVYRSMGRIAAIPEETIDSVLLQADQYYILGDNSVDANKDSRSIGPVQFRDIDGILWIKYGNSLE